MAPRKKKAAEPTELEMTTNTPVAEDPASEAVPAEAEAPAEAAPAEPEAPAEVPPAEEEQPKAVKRTTRKKKADPAVPKQADRSGLPNQVVAATKAVRREMYAGETVISMDVDDRLSPEAEKAKKDYAFLAAASRSELILEGTLEGVDTMPGANIVCGIVYYGDFKIYIPQQMLFVLNDNSLFDGANIAASQKYYASRRLGAKIRYIVKVINEEARIAVATRVLAMERDIDQFYRNKNQRGETLVKEGSLVAGQITYVTKDGVGVYLLGAETYISKENLSWNHVADAAEEGYEVGQKLVVRIKKIEPFDYEFETPYQTAGDKKKKQKYHLVKVTASAREATDDPNIKYFNQFSVGMHCRARVVGCTEFGYFVRVLEKRDILCANDFKERIPDNSVVQVRITKMEQDTHRIYGKIINIISVPS